MSNGHAIFFRQVKVYDSMYNTLNNSMKKQFTDLYPTWFAKDGGGKDGQQRSLQVTFESVQRQRGAIDCRLFAIAFVFELCMGNDVSQIQFDQRLMNEHFYRYLLQQRLTAFPKQTFNAYMQKPNTIEVINDYYEEVSTP